MQDVLIDVLVFQAYSEKQRNYSRCTDNGTPGVQYRVTTTVVFRMKSFKINKVFKPTICIMIVCYNECFIQHKMSINVPLDCVHKPKMSSLRWKCQLFTKKM